jgi:hypothetical protein
LSESLSGSLLGESITQQAPHNHTKTAPSTAPSRSKILACRLKYADRGVRTSPADTARKKPHMKGWQIKATTSPQQITAESNRWPDAGILTPTGAVFGRFVLDEDKPGEIAQLENELGVTLRGVSTEVRTPRGGVQIHFGWPEGEDIRNTVGKSAGDDFEGLDVRGEGGLVMLPPSAGYSFANRLPMAEAPPELVEWAAARKKRPTAPTEVKEGRGVASLQDDVAPIPKGARHITLASILGRAHDGTRSLEELTDLAFEVNEMRCEPPIGSTGDDPLDDVVRIARSIFSKPPCRSVREADPEIEELLEGVSSYWYERRLPKGGRSKLRDIYRACLKSAAKRREARTAIVGGEELHGLAFSESTRQLSEIANTSHVSAWKNLGRLAEMGALVRIENPDGLAPTYLLLANARQINTPHQRPSPPQKRGALVWVLTLCASMS